MSIGRQCALAPKKIDHILCCVSRSVGSRLVGVIIPLCSTLVSFIWSALSGFGFPSGGPLR